MFKYIIFFFFSYNIINAQAYKELISQICSNNNDIKTYKEYLNSVNIESRTNLFPLNPKVEFSYLSAAGISKGKRQELIISQPFDFPSVYILKSDLASLQHSTNEYRLKEFQKEIIKTAQILIIHYIYFSKKYEELKKRYELSENMLKTVQTKFDKGDVGVLELNKAKSNLSLAKSKFNLSLIDLKSIHSELNNMNGGKLLEINYTEYWNFEYSTNFDSLFTKLRISDNNYLALANEKLQYDKKVSLAKSGWLPNFDIGYRQESEADLSYNGIRLQMSIPIFENTNKVPKALSELNSIDLKIRSYATKFKLEKKRLFGKAEELKRTLEEQKSLLDFSQFELNKKSYQLGHISLTQFYTDNAMYNDIIDSLLETEKEYQISLMELLQELSSN